MVNLYFDKYSITSDHTVRSPSFLCLLRSHCGGGELPNYLRPARKYRLRDFRQSSISLAAASDDDHVPTESNLRSSEFRSLRKSLQSHIRHRLQASGLQRCRIVKVFTVPFVT